MKYIHISGADIERAGLRGGAPLDEIVAMLRRHIPARTPEAIVASLDLQLRVINCRYLNVDRPGLRRIMNLAVEGRIIASPIDTDAFADTRFAVPGGDGDG